MLDVHKCQWTCCLLLQNKKYSFYIVFMWYLIEPIKCKVISYYIIINNMRNT